MELNTLSIIGITTIAVAILPLMTITVSRVELPSSRLHCTCTSSVAPVTT